ncbi:unnamed protein product, partial [Chrysoparadoxa australica]
LYNTTKTTNEHDLEPGPWVHRSIQSLEDFLKEFAHDASVRLDDVPYFQVRRSFVGALDKTYRTLQQKISRHLGHLRQYYAVGTCIEQLEKWEEAHNERYDIVLKLRDDSVLMEPLLVEHAHTEGAHFLKCMGWGGLDDKHFIGGRDSAGKLMS